LNRAAVRGLYDSLPTSNSARWGPLTVLMYSLLTGPNASPIAAKFSGRRFSLKAAPSQGSPQLLPTNGYSAILKSPKSCAYNRHLLSCGRGPADPRFIPFKGKLVMLYSDDVCYGQRQGKLAMFAVTVLPSLGKPVELWRVNITEKMLAPSRPSCEKNWAPFVAHGWLYVSYQLSPFHVVYQINLKTGTAKLKGNTSTCDAVELAWCRHRLSTHGMLRGGTNAINWGNGSTLLAVGHLKGQRSPPLKTSYHSILYTISVKKPFEITAISQPFKLASIPIEFPTVLRRLADGRVHLWFGVDDLESRGVVMTEAFIASKFANQRLQNRRTLNESSLATSSPPLVANLCAPHERCVSPSHSRPSDQYWV